MIICRTIRHAGASSSCLHKCVCPVQVRSGARSQGTVSRPAAGSDTEDKPRLMAIDVAERIRKEKENEKPHISVSGSQKRVSELKRFTQQLQHVHPNVLAKHLHRTVLCNNKHVVVLNKPYGISVRGDKGDNTITSVLPILAKMISGAKVKCDLELFLCLNLEKDLTGTLLLSKSEEHVEHVLSMVKNNQVQRTFWAVAIGVPVPSEGVIDIPIIEKEVEGPQPHFKMALSPVYRMNESKEGLTRVRVNRQAHQAATKYKVLDSGSGYSLVELQPLTDVKHQMRVHMAFALGCIILGDHKYSHWNKLAPQKLPDHILKKLSLEQSKARHLPLHLHARSLQMTGSSVLPDLNISSPLPKFFMQTLKLLNLSLPNEKK